MPSSELVLIVAIAGFALYKQTQRQEVIGSGRFTLAFIYLIVGVAVGGFHLPDSLAEVVGVIVSLALGVVVGLLRGRWTRLWSEGGRVWMQGTPVTIGLFVGLFAVKFGYGTFAWFAGDHDSGNLADIFIMIALMIAFQTEVVWRRAKPMGARTDDHQALTSA